MKSEDLEKIFLSLYKWVKEQEYRGYDPYDWGVSPISQKLPYHLNFVMSQINLYSPVNLRKFFRIEKGVSNKALALFAQAYLTYYLARKNEEIGDEGERLLKCLDKRKISSPNGIGWASYYFPFIRKKHVLMPNQVDIIATSEALKAYSLSYYVFKKEEYRYTAKKIMSLILSDFIGKYKNFIYIKYYPSEKNKIVFNVSGLFLSATAEYLMHIDTNPEIVNVREEILKTLIHFQKGDGSWPYSYYIRDKRFKTQIDYHQGFIIDGLVNFYPYIQSPELKKIIKDSLSKAIRFYQNNQFSPEGFSYYRLPYKYPIDIHNQAQGIITFSNLYEKYRKKEYLDFALKIYEWTVDNMWDSDGYFYIHRWPFMVNKIAYVRWSQAWMTIAVSKIIHVREAKRYEADN